MWLQAGMRLGRWQFPRSENSGAQRSAGAAESVADLRPDHAPRCPLRGQTESQRNSVHQTAPYRHLFYQAAGMLDATLEVAR